MNCVTNDEAVVRLWHAVVRFGRPHIGSEACRTTGVHVSTYYRWERQLDRFGLDIRRPRGRRRPAMFNRLRHDV
jgi:hypothetical protein